MGGNFPRLILIIIGIAIVWIGVIFLASLAF